MSWLAKAFLRYGRHGKSPPVSKCNNQHRPAGLVGRRRRRRWRRQPAFHQWPSALGCALETTLTFLPGSHRDNTLSSSVICVSLLVPLTLLSPAPPRTHRSTCPRRTRTRPSSHPRHQHAKTSTSSSSSTVSTAPQQTYGVWKRKSPPPVPVPVRRLLVLVLLLPLPTRRRRRTTCPPPRPNRGLKASTTQLRTGVCK